MKIYDEKKPTKVSISIFKKKKKIKQQIYKTSILQKQYIFNSILAIKGYGNNDNSKGFEHSEIIKLKKKIQMKMEVVTTGKKPSTVEPLESGSCGTKNFIKKFGFVKNFGLEKYILKVSQIQKVRISEISNFLIQNLKIQIISLYLRQMKFKNSNKNQEKQI
eukprot:TRINITY_DN28077_c1_g1_i1.p2 TRINITY_DN28077_c1_g1~~TRINITY_DN28077_c1_g1_i1.p2  ORF type:complete len:162 (+),score=16.17 TRINITY_DN28077_c1_g1_i1:529-1014(+)